MSNLKDLLARANAKTSMRETSSCNEENQFDELDSFIQDTARTVVPSNYNVGLTKDGNELQVGDPVTGIHKGQKMSGQVININGDSITVEWRDRSTSTENIGNLILTDVDSAYEEETMYIEADQTRQSMGFDKESFVEDSDLESLLKGSESNTAFKYGNSINEF